MPLLSGPADSALHCEAEEQKDGSNSFYAVPQATLFLPFCPLPSDQTRRLRGTPLPSSRAHRVRRRPTLDAISPQSSLAIQPTPQMEEEEEKRDEEKKGGRSFEVNNNNKSTSPHVAS